MTSDHAKRARRIMWAALVVVVGAFLPVARGQDPAPAPAPAPAAAPAPAPDPAAEARRQTQAENQASLADGLYRRQLYEMAAREYETLIKEYPTYPQLADASLLLAECYRRLNQLDKAEATYRQVLAKYPGTPAHERAAVNLLELFANGKRDLSVLSIVPGLGVDKMTAANQEAVHYYAGTVYNQNKKPDEALAELAKLPSNEFREEFPFRPFAQLSTALIYRGLHQEAKASPLLQGLVDGQNVPDGVRQEAIFNLGEIAFGAQNYEQTLVIFKQLLEKFPDSPYTSQAKLSMGWAYLDLKQYRELLKLFEGIEETPLTKTGDAFFLRGSAQKELNMYEAALDTFQQLIRRFPDSHFRPYADVAVVECLYFLKRYEECVRLGEADLHGEKPHQFTLEIAQFLGQAYVELHNYEKVASTYEALLRDHWDKVTDKHQLILLLADAYERTGRFEDAARTYLRLLELKDYPDREQALLLAGQNEMKAKQFDKAYADYETLLREFSGSQYIPRALIGMAEAKVQLDQPEQAVELLNRLLTTFPDTEFKTNALYLRGSLQFRLGNTKEAIGDLAASLKEPTFAERDYARLFLAYALWDAGREGEALQLFVELLQLPSMEKNFTPKMLREIGEKYLERNNIAAAEQAFTLLSKGSDEDAKLEGLLGLGKTAFLKGQNEEANQLFEKAKKQASTDSEQYVIALAYLGETYRLLGKPDRALLAFQDGIRLGTKDPDANALLRVGLARIYYEEKRYNEALSKANAAYILFGDTKYAPEGALLSCRILIDQGKLNEAKIVYKEMESRYPVALGKFKQDPKNAELFKKLE